MVDCTKVSETWQNLLQQWLISNDGTKFPGLESNDCVEIDEFCVKLATQTYAMAKLIYTIGERIHASDCFKAKLAFTVWPYEFMEQWKNILGKSLQLTSM